LEQEKDSECKKLKLIMLNKAAKNLSRFSDLDKGIFEFESTCDWQNDCELKSLRDVIMNQKSCQDIKVVYLKIYKPNY
jgi:hypothetical protein